MINHIDPAVPVPVRADRVADARNAAKGRAYL
jgi:hypothetical protein